MDETVTRPGPWRIVLDAAAPRWRGLVAVWVLTLASAGVALLQPWPLQVLVDHAIGQVADPSWLVAVRAALPGAGSSLGLAAWAAGATLIVFAIDAYFDVALTMRWVTFGQGAVYTLGRALFARLQRRSPVFHALTPVGDSVSRITGDSWCVYNAASALLFTPLYAVVVGGAAAVVLFRLDADLGAVAFAAAPIVTASSLLLGRKARHAKGREREAESHLESHVQQTLSGMAVVQAFAQELREQQRFRSLTGQAMAAQRRSAVIAAMSSAAAGLITTMATGAVLGIGGMQVLRGRLTLGDLLVFIAYLGIVNAQLTALAGAWTTARGISVSTQRAADVLDREPEVRSPVAPSPMPPTPRGLSVQLHHVSFAYVADRTVLNNLDLDVPAGATVAVVGPSGIGKSTLAALIPRLMDPGDGEVLLGGIPARELSLDDLRSAVAIVFQEPMLLSGTIAENIRLGRPGASDAQVEKAGRAAGAHEFISRLPDGYDTILGDRGATLSGGERQRIAIARALIKDAPVLVLDEPTASLDAATEAGLVDTLERARRGRTTLIISHRLSTVRSADRIAVLDAGRIAEQGTHAELLLRGGLYARMWNLQHGPGRALTEGAA